MRRRDVGTLGTSEAWNWVKPASCDCANHLQRFAPYGALKVVAQRLFQTVREGDAVARLGGDEFAILQSPSATLASAEGLALRITDIVARPYSIGDDTMSVGVSVGICLPDGAAYDTERAMRQADKALYTVKQAGGGKFATASA